MTAAETIVTCEHEWRWLSAVELAIDSSHNLLRGENVECVGCGARTWAHGHHGNLPMVTVPATPTTGRS